MSQTDDYFQHILDDTAPDTELADLPANEFCIDDTSVDITMADYIELDLDESPKPDQPKKAA